MNTTAIKSALSYPKAKRGDVVVIELTSSYTTAKFKTERSTSYYFAKVTKTSQGKVVDYVKANGARGIVDTRHRVMCITEADKQAAVRDLFGTELGAMDFDNVDQVKAAILDRVEALR
jgi:hypothetical protein